MWLVYVVYRPFTGTLIGVYSTLERATAAKEECCVSSEIKIETFVVNDDCIDHEDLEEFAVDEWNQLTEEEIEDLLEEEYEEWDDEYEEWEDDWDNDDPWL